MSRAAIRYAKAILETALSSGKENQVNDDMKSIITAVNSSADLKDFLASPIITSEVKMNVLSEVFGSVEAVKTVSDLFMPVSGEILEFNGELEANPEAVNKDPYGSGWMIKVQVSDMSELDGLMDAAAYQDLVG